MGCLIRLNSPAIVDRLFGAQWRLLPVTVVPFPGRADIAILFVGVVQVESDEERPEGESLN
jgi:hypothetical protein